MRQENDQIIPDPATGDVAIDLAQLQGKLKDLCEGEKQDYNLTTPVLIHPLTIVRFPDEKVSIAQQWQCGWPRNLIAHNSHPPGLIPPVIHGECSNDTDQGHHQGGIIPRTGGRLQNTLNVHLGGFTSLCHRY